MTNFKQALWGAVCLLAVGMVSSCGTKNDGSLLERVPGEASSVMTVDFKKLFKEAGAPTPLTPGGEWTDAAGKIASTFCPPDFVEALRVCALPGSGAELDHVVIFEMATGAGGLIVKVDDEDEFVEKAAAGEAEKLGEVGEYDVYACPQGGVLAVDDHLALFTQSQQNVSDFVDAVARQRVEEFAGLRQFLNQGKKAVSFALNCDNSPSQAAIIGGKEQWLCASMEPNRQAINAEAVVMDRGGKLTPIGGYFEEIDPRVLAFIPGDAVGVAAFGRFTGDLALVKTLISQYAPFLTVSETGTTALSASPAGGAESLREFSLPAWNLVDIVKVSPDERQALVAKTRLNPLFKKISDNQWAIDYIPGIELYVGDFDGYYVTSLNREISNANNNSFAQDFEGRHLAVVVNIPAGSDVQRAASLPFGLTLSVGLQEDKLKVRLSFNGTDLPALQALGQVIDQAFDTDGEMFSPMQIFMPGLRRQASSMVDRAEQAADSFDELEGQQLEPVE